mmetsp:Transcript_14169/g.28400  ORF Transcript_14169/g.28400 Transcript_14169/m.28400 type:complete len:114 (-) Transcript_14169:3362-3703(-)
MSGGPRGLGIEGKNECCSFKRQLYTDAWVRKQRDGEKDKTSCSRKDSQALLLPVIMDGCTQRKRSQREKGRQSVFPHLPAFPRADKGKIQKIQFFVLFLSAQLLLKLFSGRGT